MGLLIIQFDGSFTHFKNRLLEADKASAVPGQKIG
jgi:hypothetical protein